jgi:outer membrane biosynthesis protein TonB
MSKAKKKPDLTSLMGGAAKVSSATVKASTPEPEPIPDPVEATPVPTPKPKPVKRTIRPPVTRTTSKEANSKEEPKPKSAPKKKSDDYMMTSIAFDADDMQDLQEVSMSFMQNSGSLKYPTRNMVAKVGIKAAHILSQEDPERLLELFELIRSKDRRYSENRD